MVTHNGRIYAIVNYWGERWPSLTKEILHYKSGLDIFDGPNGGSSRDKIYLKTAFTLISSFLAPIAIIVYALIRLRKGIAFLKKSKTTRAVVVKTNVEATPEGDAYYLVVRFQTNQQEWIT